MVNEETRTIFDMLKNGAITVEEAEKLFEAVSTEDISAHDDGRAIKTPGIMPVKLRVNVIERGISKVNISLPFGIVRYALRVSKNIGGLFGRFSNDMDIGSILHEIDIDEIMESLEAGENELPLTIVDVDVPEDGVTVRVILE